MSTDTWLSVKVNQHVIDTTLAHKHVEPTRDWCHRRRCLFATYEYSITRSIRDRSQRLGGWGCAWILNLQYASSWIILQQQLTKRRMKEGVTNNTQFDMNEKCRWQQSKNRSLRLMAKKSWPHQNGHVVGFSICRAQFIGNCWRAWDFFFSWMI
jgi:hypothetical protein